MVRDMIDRLLLISVKNSVEKKSGIWLCQWLVNYYYYTYVELSLFSHCKQV